MRWLGGRLSTRMVLAFSALLVGVGVFMVAFFPAGMADRAERATQANAMSIAAVLAAAVAPAVEFDDPEHARTILGWVATIPEARFAILRRPDGAAFATWERAAPPETLVWPATTGSWHDDELLIATVEVHGVTDGRARLHVGFSLIPLQRERSGLRQTVAAVSGLVVLVGVAATFLATRLIVRPIRRLTDTARRIARGEQAAELPPLPGNDEVAELATALRALLERIHEQNQQELLRASRHAGMAEVATGVLHNVGNVLNSVNVTLELMHERNRAAPVQRLQQLQHLLAGQSGGALDPARLSALGRFVDVLAEAFEADRTGLTRDLDALRAHVDHIKRVVQMQNAYARQGGMVELTRLRALVDEAVAIACPTAARRGITIANDVPDEAVSIDRHRALQIVVNLVANARDAVSEAQVAAHRISIRGEVSDQRVVIRVTDTGHGFSAETAAQLFGAGFTTKRHGHGYGLHSSALTARQLGGELTASSDGPGQGATFTLSLPVAPVARSQEQAA